MTKETLRDVVTGAFSYTGQYVTQRLLKAGREVRTLTNHPSRPHSFGSQIGVFPYDFENTDRLVVFGKNDILMYRVLSVVRSLRRNW